MGITASSIGLNRTIEAAADGQAPFDITVQNQNADHLGCVDFDAPADRPRHGSLTPWPGGRTPLIYYNDPAVTGIEDASAAIRLSDCNGLLARQGALAYPGPLPGLLAEGSAPLATGNLGLTCVVIPDEMAEKLSLRRQVWSADYAGDPEETEKQVQAALAEYQETTAYLRVESRLSLYQEIMGNKLLALFLGLYLGLTFLLAAAAVLALQQLEPGRRQRRAVRRPAPPGRGRRGCSPALRVQQVALAFLLPLALALLHTVVGMKAANDLISTAAKVDTVHSALVTGGVLLAVYGGTFWRPHWPAAAWLWKAAAHLADAGERGPRRRINAENRLAPVGASLFEMPMGSVPVFGLALEAHSLGLEHRVAAGVLLRSVILQSQQGGAAGGG